MYKGKKVVVVMPAYNAAKTLEKTYNEIDFSIVDDVVLVDDCSSDNTSEVGQSIGINHIIRHKVNKGYGGNQKTCYDKSLSLDADVTIMVHPDYQYTPTLIPAMVSMIVDGEYPAVIASRFLGKGARKGGMPLYKYVFNRILTWSQNFLINERLSEYHTGYRAFNKDILSSMNLKENSDNFIFDNEMLSQILYAGHLIGEITCPTKYFEEASSINLLNSSYYGAGVLRVSLQHFLQKLGVIKLRRYETLTK